MNAAVLLPIRLLLAHYTMKVSITGVKGYFHHPENQYMRVLWSAPSRQPNNKSILYLADSTENMDQ